MQIKNLLILILLIVFIGCDNKKSTNDFKEKYPFPSGFIDPHTKVDIHIDEKTNGILESLTNYNLSNQYKSCYDSNANHCDGIITKTVEIFFNFTIEDKEISFLTNYNRNCTCKQYYGLSSSLETISLNKISRIDTISIEEDSHGEKLVSIMIYPKYNNDEVKYKNIRLTYDSINNNYGFTKDNGTSNDPIIIHAKKNLAINLKGYLEELARLEKP